MIGRQLTLQKSPTFRCYSRLFWARTAESNARLPLRISLLGYEQNKGECMPHYGVLRDTSLEGVEDIRGAEVYGVNDEKLGKIQDVIFDHSSGDIRYVVVDTGGLLGGKKFMVPANRVEPYGNHDDKFYAELDKERIQMLPEYDEKHLKSEDSWADYERRYQNSWNEGNVMYNRNTGRIVTPPPQEVQGGRTKPLSKEGKESLERDFTPERRGQERDLWGVAS